MRDLRADWRLWSRAERFAASLLIAIALLAAALIPIARADTADELRAIYGEFATAQNARDLEKVGALLLDSPKFLWVSDGKAIWGREAVLRRMASFQGAETWHNDADLQHSVAVEASENTAFLHLPVQLMIGSEASPGKFRFLVSVLCVRTALGWRIAALFTTTENPN
jgi:ketosteroid isomerase-like protein